MKKSTAKLRQYSVCAQPLVSEIPEGKRFSYDKILTVFVDLSSAAKFYLQIFASYGKASDVSMANVAANILVNGQAK